MTLPRMDLAAAGRTISENVEFARLAEARGWQGVWVSELAGVEGVVLASALAGALESGRVGSAILPMQTRDPMLLAMASASINQLCPGGFVLGLGTSTELIVRDWHATDWGKPLALTRECVDLTRRFLSGERVTTESGRWRYRRAQLTGVTGGEDVPIYLAALNDRMLELAGEISDGVILNFVSIEDVKHARQRIHAGAARAGRSPDDIELLVFFRASVVEDFESVRERYQRELFTYVMAPVYQKMFARSGYAEVCTEVESLWRAGERERALASVPESLIRSRALVGSAGEILERLGEYAAVGVDAVMVAPVPVPALDFAEDARRIITELTG